MSTGRGLRRSRESVQEYQQGSDEEEENDEALHGDDGDAQYDEDDDEQQAEDGEEEEEEGEGEEGDTGDDEDGQQGDESVGQEEEDDDDDVQSENEEDVSGMNDTKELDEQQQRHRDDEQQPADDQDSVPSTAQSAPLAPFTFTPGAPSSTTAPFSFPSSSALPASTIPFSFPPLATSATAATSSSSLSGSAFGSIKGPIAPFSFSAGSLPSSSSAPGSTFSVPPISSSSASSSSAAPAFTFPSTSSSTSAPSSSFSFSAASQPVTTSSAVPPSSRTSGPVSSSTSAPPSSTAVSTTAAGTTIRVPLSTSSLSAVWSPHDDLLFYPFKPAPTTASARNNQPPHPPAPSSLSLFRWPPVYGETSTLLHAWHAVFASTQRQAAERVASRQRAEGMEWRLVVLSQSHCYRAELEACLYRAVQSLSSTAVASELKRANVSETEYHSHLRILETVSSTWHLFELLYLDPHDNLTVQLTDWMQRSYLAPSLDGLAVDSDEWWDCVLGLLVQGRLVAVVDALRAAEGQLLQFVSASAWQQLLELIETLPSLTAHASSVTQLVALVRDYRLAVQRLATSSAALMSHPFLPYLLAVLAGDEQAIGTICPTWMQLLVARLIFIQPHTTKADIPQLVTQCIQQKDDKENADAGAGPPADKATDGGKALDALREHVLCFRVHSAVLLADQMFDMPYFTAHLVDLLHHAALMPTLQDDADAKAKAGKRNNNAAAAAQKPAVDKLGSMTPRDWYVLQYVNSVIAHERLWTLTPDYIQSLTTPAIRPVQALCTLLLRQPCSSYAQLSQLQAMAARLQLPALVGQQLALRLGHFLLRSGQVGSAVTVYQRAGEEGKERVRQIARKLLFALIKGNGDAEDIHGGELITAMECVLDNISEEWLDDERGNPDILLLQHWADYTTIAHHLHTANQPLNPSPPSTTQPTALSNIFQSDQASLLLPLGPAQAAVAMDGVEEGEAVGGLLQDGVALLVSLLTAPLVVGSVDGGGGGAAVVYTPQSFHLPLLARLCGLLRRVEAGGMGCELSAGAVRDVLHALSRCELSWQWEEWKADAGVSNADVLSFRRTLLQWLQTTSTAEESAKRISVRV